MVPSLAGDGNTTMYRFSKRQLLWVGVLVFFSGFALAEQLRTGYLRVSASVENFRDAPNGRKLGSLVEGVEIEKITQEGKWVRFRVEGWIWGPSLEGFVEERPRVEEVESAPAPRQPLQDALPRVRRLINEEFGTFYGLSIDGDLEILRIRLRVGDIGPERLRARQQALMSRVWGLVSDDLDTPIETVRVETNRADGSGAVGTVMAECPVDVLVGEEVDDDAWGQAARFSSDGGQTWDERP